MAMTIDEFKNIGGTILSEASKPTEAGVDVGVISDNLSKLADAYLALAGENTQYKAVNEDLVKKNESLRETNMGLFLQIGDTRPMKEDGTQKSSAETITFDDILSRLK